MKNAIGTIIKELARARGYDIERFSRHGSATWEGYDLLTILDEPEARIIRCVMPYTMTGVENVEALIEAVKYVVRSRIPGDIVECGVWKGGSMMAIAKTLLSLQSMERHLYLFDTFEGMTEPGEVDVDFAGRRAIDEYRTRNEGGNHSTWCYSPLEDVKRAMYSTGYERSKMHFVRGRVEDTLPGNAPEMVSLLRLDTDWYGSTRHELVHLFPRLSVGGIIIIDDYGHWRGARKAVDEYISQNDLRLFLNRVNYTARVAVKI